jgi:hypothetical protein
VPKVRKAAKLGISGTEILSRQQKSNFFRLFRYFGRYFRYFSTVKEIRSFSE